MVAIVAMDKNQGIGLRNQLPWYIPSDLQLFRALTLNHTVIMGRKTYESIGKPLPYRRNIVVSSSLKDDRVEIVNKPPIIKGAFVIGGVSIYKELLPYCDYLYATEIDHAFECDAFFPSFKGKCIYQADTKMYTGNTIKQLYPTTFKIYQL